MIKEPNKLVAARAELQRAAEDFGDPGTWPSQKRYQLPLAIDVRSLSSDRERYR